MRRSRSALAVLALAGVAALFGCKDTPITTQQKTVIYQNVEDWTNKRILTITSNQYYLDRKQKEVGPKVEEFVNGGEHNVLSVKTFYSNAYLTSAEIQYSIADDYDNRTLRVEFIHSDQYYLDRKQKEVGPRLDEIVNSGQRNIKDVNTVMLEGYLVAAEVYYTDE